MPQFVKVSADEAHEATKSRSQQTAKGEGFGKTTKAAPSWNKDKRVARFVMTTSQVDRYQDIIVTDGIDTKEFELNPVGLLFHNSKTWPVANWSNLMRTTADVSKMEGDFEMLPPGGPIKEIDQAAWMLDNGGIRACSIGFIPDWNAMEAIKDDSGNRTGGYRFNKSELVECSICAVPANPGALIKQAEAGISLAKDLLEDILDNWARMPNGLVVPRSEYEAKYFEVAGERTTIVYGKREAGDIVEIFGLKATEKDGETVYEPEPIQLKQGVAPPVNLAEQERTFTDSVVMRIATMFGLKPKTVEPAPPSPEIPAAPALLSPEKSAEIMAGAAAVRERLKKYA